MTPRFNTDENNDLILYAVTGWTAMQMEGVALLLAIQYAETDEALVAGQSTQIQFALTAQQALDLAALLATHARRVLEPDPGKAPN